jgi:biopolymer transport protein ExbB
MLGYLIDAFSGPAAAFMYALLAVMAFAIAVALERAYTFSTGRFDAEKLKSDLEDAFAAGRVPDFPAHNPAEKVLKAGLRWPDAELAWEAMTEASIAAEQSLRQRVAYLSTVASIATMIGLFGTVYGLIMSFAALGDVAATERAARLSEGSSTAMASTAFGLLVAIPALAAHAFAEATVRERLSAIEGLASRLILLLKARSRA